MKTRWINCEGIPSPTASPWGLSKAITRPAISEKRLSLTNQGKVRYELKTSYRDGTTHVIFEPVDFIAKLEEKAPMDSGVPIPDSRAPPQARLFS